MRKHYKDDGSIQPMLDNFSLPMPSVGEAFVTVTSGDGQYVVGRDECGPYVAWRPFTERMDELRSAHEALRAEIIARDGAIDPAGIYPQLDVLAAEMFRILSAGGKSISVTAAQVLEASVCPK